MITQEYLKSILSYDPLTGLWLWIVDKGKKIKSGNKAGKIDKLGYAVIQIDNKSYFAHRLAFLYMIGRFPINLVDHINRIKNDNIWINLREATASQNQRNVIRRIDNKIGVKGVYKNKDGLFIVRIRIGSYKTLIEANKALNEASKLLHAEFYNKT